MDTHIYIDIENTLIDDFFNCNLLHVQCDKVSRHVLKIISESYSSTPVKVNLFTWGWKTHDEIRPEIVMWLFDVLEIPEENRGTVWTKDDSIQCAYKHKWVNTTDEVELEDLHIPGAMKRFGLENRHALFNSVWTKQVFRIISITRIAASSTLLTIQIKKVFTKKENLRRSNIMS